MLSRGLTVQDVKIHDCNWEDYLRLPGISFSGLKEKPEMNEGIRIGSLVHKYILKPSEYNYESPEIVRPIANALINFVGHSLINQMVCEKGVTAKFVIDQIVLLWKGMPDMFFINNIIIDFKIISGDLDLYVNRFRYKDQLRGYMFPLNCLKGLIIAYNKKKKRVETYFVELDDMSFWHNVVLTRGEVIN